MIIRGGENIYPREIEEVLHEHPDILDAYVRKRLISFQECIWGLCFGRLWECQTIGWARSAARGSNCETRPSSCRQTTWRLSAKTRCDTNSLTCPNAICTCSHLSLFVYQITYFKIPRYVMFVDSFPLTSTGKAQKFIMREKSCEQLGLKERKWCNCFRINSTARRCSYHCNIIGLSLGERSHLFLKCISFSSKHSTLV